MARTVKQGRDGRTPVVAASISPGGRKPRWRELTEGERLSTVWKAFLDDLTVTKIVEQIHQTYDAPTSFNRGSIYDMFRKAAQADRLLLVPKASTVLTDGLRKRFPLLKEVAVTQTLHFEDIARRGANMLIDSLKQPGWAKRKEVHIGLAGGHAVRRLMQIFAELLSETDDDLPKTLVLHALVAGFDILEPTTDPNTFFTMFEDKAKFATQFKFVGLPSPPRAEPDQYESLRRSDWFRECYKYARALDIILTSGATWLDEHSTFRQCMERSKSSLRALDRAGCAGDILWRPVGPEGPLDIQTDIRSMTLLELKDLADFVEKGKHVYPVLGPCAGCGRTKSELLSAVLASPKRLISHLICDSHTANGALVKKQN